MPEIHPCQRDATWLKLRIGHVSASTAAGALGLDPYKSRQAAWREIVGQKTDAEANEYANNRHMQRGVLFEPKARLQYEADTGHWVNETGLWQSAEHPWLQASPDGSIPPEGGLECKCPMAPPPRVPVHHKIQMWVQMIVCEWQWVDYYSYGASETFLCRVNRPEQSVLDSLIRALHGFYLDHVVAGVCPPRKVPRRRRKCVIEETTPF